MEEAEELERAAECRMRKDDTVSREAAVLLQKLADDVRLQTGRTAFREYTMICNWLGESGEIADFMDMARDYRLRIGVDRFPQDGEAYLQALIELAKQMFGAG